MTIDSRLRVAGSGHSIRRGRLGIGKAHLGVASEREHVVINAGLWLVGMSDKRLGRM